MVDNYLIKKKLVYRLKSPKEVVKKVAQILNDSEDLRRKQRELAHNLLTQMEDPLDVIIAEIESDH
jgi:predicted glycosyltransferase